MDKTVTIYSTPTCHFCHAAKEFFKENNVAYTEHDVAGDQAKRQDAGCRGQGKETAQVAAEKLGLLHGSDYSGINGVRAT